MTKTPLQTIPGVGKSVSRNLKDIGINFVEDLKGKNPEKLYAQSNQKVGVKQDRCLLYVFRCAVYYASHRKYDKKKLLWWYWVDKKKNGLPRTKREI